MQNLVSLSLTPDDLATMDGALATLEKVLSRGIALTPQQRRDLYTMGDKSEAFCRHARVLLTNNPQVVPPSLSVTEGLADLQALDALRPRLDKLRPLTERAEDTQLALGSDVMGVALEGYALLKAAHNGETLKSAHRDLSARFVKQGKRAEPALAE